MLLRCFIRYLSILVILAIVSCSQSNNTKDGKLKGPPGFIVSLYTDKVPGARQMALGANNVVFVGSRKFGKVYAVIPNTNHTHASRVEVIAKGLNTPNGVAFRDGDLYVAEVNRILRYDHIDEQLKDPPKPIVINNEFPNERHHGRRYIKFGPDGKLYISVGAPCNACLRQNPQFGTIMRMNDDGTDLEIFAKGIRNSVGFDWDPETNFLWFTDNGRDWMGDNEPPDELNVAPKMGMNFGFPYFYGKHTPDPKFGDMYPITDFTPPVLDLPAHVAVLGTTFYSGELFPEKYKNAIFIAEHGSWNRSEKIGYQVIVVFHKGNRVIGWKPFVTGWLRGEEDWGRPVDVLAMPDGSLLVSDDKAGAIYRVSYQG